MRDRCHCCFAPSPGVHDQLCRTCLHEHTIVAGRLQRMLSAERSPERRIVIGAVAAGIQMIADGMRGVPRAREQAGRMVRAMLDVMATPGAGALHREGKGPAYELAADAATLIALAQAVGLGVGDLGAIVDAVSQPYPMLTGGDAPTMKGADA